MAERAKRIASAAQTKTRNTLTEGAAHVSRRLQGYAPEHNLNEADKLVSRTRTNQTAAPSRAKSLNDSQPNPSPKHKVPPANRAPR